MSARSIHEKKFYNDNKIYRKYTHTNKNIRKHTLIKRNFATMTKIDEKKYIYVCVHSEIVGCLIFCCDE